MNNVYLPKRLSACIRVALQDLELVENDPRYLVDMQNWHLASGYRCLVCFAGSVIAKTLGAEPTQCISPNSYGWPDRRTAVDLEWNNDRITALDQVRTGKINTALEFMKVDFPKDLLMIDVARAAKLPLEKNRFNECYLRVTPYMANKQFFKREIAAIATALEQHDY